MAYIAQKLSEKKLFSFLVFANKDYAWRIHLGVM